MLPAPCFSVLRPRYCTRYYWPYLGHYTRTRIVIQVPTQLITFLLFALKYLCNLPEDESIGTLRCTCGFLCVKPACSSYLQEAADFLNYLTQWVTPVHVICSLWKLDGDIQVVTSVCVCVCFSKLQYRKLSSEVPVQFRVVELPQTRSVCKVKSLNKGDANSEVTVYYQVQKLLCNFINILVLK